MFALTAFLLTTAFSLSPVINPAPMHAAGAKAVVAIAAGRH